MRTLPDLRRSTTALVIDHVTPHFALHAVSVHVLEESIETVDGEDGQEQVRARRSGFDIDGVTPAELGLHDGDNLLESLTEAMLVAFVEGLSDGLPVRIDQAPAEK